MENLASTILADVVVNRVGAKYGLSALDLRVLGAVSLLAAGGGRPTLQAVVQLLALGTDSHTRTSLTLLAAGHYLSKAKAGRRSNQQGGALSLRIEPAGVALLGTLEREERAARASVASIEVGRWKRKYVRSGPYVGKAARDRARREARQAGA